MVSVIDAEWDAWSLCILVIRNAFIMPKQYKHGEAGLYNF